MAKVLITGWQVGLHKISMTKLIQQYTPLGLSDAKAATDRVLDGETVTLTVTGSEEAERLVQSLKEIGVDAQVVQE